jgi:protoheme IX farnesyltransferase
MRSPAERVRPYAELCKPRISGSTTLSAGAGFLLAGSGIGPQLGIALGGVFLLACGACGLNQYQERGIDALMPRTEKRPLPSGRIRPLAALIFSTALLAAGSVFLRWVGQAPVLLGLCSVVWYNGFYTFLKRKTAFAAIPGAVIGALPVSIGWVSAGGDISDPRMFFLCFFFFMWQVPHFWLFVQERGEEYRKAGLPSLTSIFSEAQLARINFIWMSAAGISGIFMTAAGVARSSAVNLALLGLSLWIIWNGVELLGKSGSVPGRITAFNRVNIYMVFVTLALAADRFI